MSPRRSDSFQNRSGSLPRRSVSSTVSTPALALGLAVAAASVFAPATLHAQAREVTRGAIYQAGTVVTSPVTGIAFRVPEGYAGQWDADAGALVFQSDVALGGVWGWSEGTIEEAAAEVESRLSELGIELTMEREPELTAERLRGTFGVISPEIRGTMAAEVRRGPNGQVVAVAAIGETAAPADAFVDAAIGSLDWSAPVAAGWRQEVEGSVLQWTGSGSDMSSGTTTATGASQSSATLAFCGGGYRYAESSESYVSIDGVSASSSSSDEHAGEWYLIADLTGSPTLYLFSQDGRSFAWSVEESNDGYLIDGYLYRPSGGC